MPRPNNFIGEGQYAQNWPTGDYSLRAYGAEFSLKIRQNYFQAIKARTFWYAPPRVRFLSKISGVYPSHCTVRHADVG